MAAVFLDGPFGLFNIGSLGYDLMTAHELWHEQIACMLELVPIPRDDVRLLDLGCGPGVSTFVLAQRLSPAAQLVGVDLAHRMIERAKRHQRKRFAELSNLRFLQADASALPFEDESFDLATGHSFLYLVSNRTAVLQEVLRVLTPGGRLVLMEPHAGGSLRQAALAKVGALPQALRHPSSLGRFVTSMMLWRLVSARAGQMEPAQVDQLFRQAGFVEVSIQPTLAGLGLHCIGRKPS